MFKKKFWIPVVLVLIGIAIGSTFWGRHIARQEPVKIYKTTNVDPISVHGPSPERPQPAAEGGHFHADGVWHADDAHSGGGNPQGIASDLNAGRQTRIDAEIEAARQQGATDAEILKKLQAAGHQVDTDSEIQEALYRQRVKQYLKDREEWNKKFHQAHTERMQAGEAVVSFIPNLSPNRSVKAIATYLDSLSDDERKQLFAEYDALVAKSEAAVKKLDAVKQEEPVFPTNE